MEQDNVPTVFELQQRAQNASDVSELEQLRDLVSTAIGTSDQKFAVGQFIKGRIKDPHRKCFT